MEIEKVTTFVLFFIYIISSAVSFIVKHIQRDAIEKVWSVSSWRELENVLLNFVLFVRKSYELN